MGFAVPEIVPWHHFTSSDVPLLVLRITLACVLGAVLGWDRARQEKPAGIRTHVLVSLGAVSYTLIAVDIGADRDNGHVDPSRVVQGIVGGIGFLGAGAIIQSRGQVHGLTTAASVWVAGAAGTACGIGAYVVAVLTGSLGLLALIASTPVGGRPNSAKEQMDPLNQRGPSEGAWSETSPSENSRAERPAAERHISE